MTTELRHVAESAELTGLGDERGNPIPVKLPDLLERFLGAGPQSRADAFRKLAEGLKRSVMSENVDVAIGALRRAVLSGLDFTAAQTLCRIHSQIRKLNKATGKKTRLAVLGSFTTTQLVPLLKLQLFALGIDAEVYEADYGVFRQEVLDSNSGLYEFGPQVVFLATSWRDLARRPGVSSDREAVARVVEAEREEWQRLWETLQLRLGCQVVQNNFALPPHRTFANHEMRHPGSLHRYLAAMNYSLVDAAPPFVTIHDVDHLAGLWGRWNWDDPRFVHQAKLPCAPEYLVDYAHSVASLIGAQLGFSKKCLVLDLDNTLWGGVIGDDGLGGIRLGQGEPEGEAFLAFQQYVKALGERGVILAVCSKNTDTTAREAFEKHTEMVLRLPDIACFVANWEDKATNLRTIAATLNIGLDSLVFVDDNPAERAIVRRLVPEVAVPELPEDAAGYPQALEEHRYFQVVSLAAEDFQRTEYYRSDTLRKSAEASAEDIESFLRSLEMTARVGPIDVTTLERSAQLISRSNQFNLTTRRRTAAELAALLDDPVWITLTVSLTDRFGDNGLISVLLAREAGGALEIETWLMSCRVLKRGVEQFLLGCVGDLARARGLGALRGEYIPTAKNALVRDHYSGLGFRQTAAAPDGKTSWELDLRGGWTAPQTLIALFMGDSP